MPKTGQKQVAKVKGYLVHRAITNDLHVLPAALDQHYLVGAGGVCP